MADFIQQLQVKAYLEQEMNKRAFQSNLEMMKGAGLFGGMEGQTAGQPSMSLSPAGNQFSKAPFRQNTPALSSLNNSPEADPSMFIRKPSFNIDPMTGKVTMGISEVENPYFRQKMDIEKAKQIEDQKPYSADEIKLASGKLLIPQIDKLIKLIKEENVYGEGKFFGNLFPFGASRISSFGEAGAFVNPLKRGFTAGAGRKAGLILQDIKKIMFATGGQALTDPEIQKLGPKLNPAYKTEEEWIADLEDAKNELNAKVRMLRTNPNEAFNQEGSSSESNAQQSLPSIGSTFNGEKVIKVKKIK